MVRTLFLRSLLSQLLRLPHSLRPGGGKAFAGVKKYGAHINHRQGLLEERKALFGAGFDNQEPFFEPQQWVCLYNNHVETTCCETIVTGACVCKKNRIL